LLGVDDPVARVGELLRERPALLILDNFESALGSAPLLPAEELRAVLDAVWGWVAPGKMTRGQDDKMIGSRVLITTRDTNVGDARFRPSRLCRHVELGGLARDDAMALAAAPSPRSRGSRCLPLGGPWMPWSPSARGAGLAGFPVPPSQWSVVCGP
jgi:hypothetical protein